MHTYHLASRDQRGVRPLCDAPRDEPVLSPEDFRAQAKAGGRVCDRCVAAATERQSSPSPTP